MKPIDFTNLLFTDANAWLEISNHEKRSQFFYCNRRFAIQYPLQAHKLQQLKVNESDVLDFWQRFMWVKYGGKIPGFMYTPGTAKSKETHDKKTDMNPELITIFCRATETDRKSIIDALEFFPDDMRAELKQFEKISKQ